MSEYPVINRREELVEDIQQALNHIWKTFDEYDISYIHEVYRTMEDQWGEATANMFHKVLLAWNDIHQTVVILIGYLFELSLLVDSPDLNPDSVMKAWLEAANKEQET